jgi:hypothetical protein
MLEFTEQGFQWIQSDTVQTGDYRCEGQNITATASGREVMGQLNADGTLSGLGEIYVLDSAD